MKEQEKIIHYPIVFQFVLITLITFDLYIFYLSNVQTKFYCLIMLFVLLNGWASSIDDDFKYGSLYLLIDALCCALYFLMLLYIKDGIYSTVWLLSSLIAILYVVWNVLLLKFNNHDENKKKELKSYNLSNVALLFFSLLSFFILTYVENTQVQLLIQILGGLIWLLLLFKWYYDNYFAELKKIEKK